MPPKQPIPRSAYKLDFHPIVLRAHENLNDRHDLSIGYVESGLRVRGSSDLGHTVRHSSPGVITVAVIGNEIWEDLNDHAKFAVGSTNALDR